jgi:hypothetical protein
MLPLITIPAPWLFVISAALSALSSTSEFILDSE